MLIIPVRYRTFGLFFLGLNIMNSMLVGSKFEFRIGEIVPCKTNGLPDHYEQCQLIGLKNGSEGRRYNNSSVT